jgi:hypothetical protein
MVNEVESILNEIRERVRSDQEQSSAQVASPDETPGDSVPRPLSPGHNESLSRLSAHLTTTSRAWDRLPPLYSNRSGGAARFELWIKARLKSLTRWFTWEQVNFNSAVHHALSESLHALSASQQDLAGLRAELNEEAESWRERFGRSERELAALRTSIEALTAEIRKRNTHQDARSAAIEARSGAIEARTDALEARATETAVAMTKEFGATQMHITALLTELAGELRASDEQLRQEHRVCFKQLSLEAGETAVREDRGQRVIQSRLEKLEKAAANGEK